jgi:hypothetical protein
MIKSIPGIHFNADPDSDFQRRKNLDPEFGAQTYAIVQTTKTMSNISRLPSNI